MSTLRKWCVSKDFLQLFIHLLGAVFVGLILQANLVAAGGDDQEWVIPFDVQQRNDYIWDGKRTTGTEKIEEEYNELKEIQSRHHLNTNIFIINGYYCTDTHLKYFAPEIHARFIQLYSKLESLESIEGFSSDASKLAALNEEIQQLRSSLPPKIDFNNYLWHTYCRGIERDFGEGAINPISDCACCKGKGKVSCGLCKGKGKVGFYNPSIDVIDPDSRTRKEYRKQELERKKKYRQLANPPKKKRPTMPGSRSPMPGMQRPSSIEEIAFQLEEEKNREHREEILQQKEEEKRSRQAKMEERRKRNEQIECAVCQGRGWCACPDCVLVNKPHYSASAKIKYFPRWSKLKTEKWH